MENSLYPPGPVDVDAEKLAVSPAFRKQVSAVITSIILFALVYLLLVAAAIILAILLCWFGISLIIALPKFLTLILGLGLIGVGVSVVVFLVKFIFAVAKDENTRRVEITEEEQPRLFAFIRRLTQETQTSFPKKIFVSPDVNASVFYNSSFWSMFLPVRKNLEIGLGLVNSINVSEFKAVMAHEFGHFSQKSMKLGSFTYNVNKVIHNMLYDNNSYTSFLHAWGNIHGYLSIFAALTVKIAQSIQWVLRGMYKFINRNYMGLSRQMEFHADTVAAGVSGGNNLVSALSRIQVAGGCYEIALSNANDRLKDNKIAKNIFSNQLTILRSLADDPSFSRSRINYKDQWASHPTLAERKAHLDQLAIEATPDDRSPWLLFDSPETLQEKLTRNLYSEVPLKDDTQQYDAEEFEHWYGVKKNTYALPGDYKGFYDDRFVRIDWDLNEPNPSPQKSFDEIFNEDTGRIQASINHLAKDIEVVKAIKERRLDVTSFDFDGVKHSLKDVENVIHILEKDIALLSTRLQVLDRAAYYFFLQKAADPEAHRNAYWSYQSVSIQYDEYVDLVNTTLKTIHPFYAGGITLETVNAIISTLKEKYEPRLKKAYRQFTVENLINSENDPGLYPLLQSFIEKNYLYFVSERFQNEELNELTSLAIRTAESLGRQRFIVYKKMVEQQLSK